MSLPPTFRYDPRLRMGTNVTITVDVPARPSLDDFATAVEALRISLDLYPFADSKRMVDEDGIERTDRSQLPGVYETAALVTMVAAVARPSMPFAPVVYVVGDPISGGGAGKTHLVTTRFSFLAIGTAPMTFALTHDDKENEQRFATAFMIDPPVLMFDNANNMKIKSDTLAMATSNEVAQTRVLGGNDRGRISSTGSVFITGNGASPSEDQVRRSLLIKLDPRCEQPENRRFPPGTAPLDRGALVSAALTVWRWGVQNRATLPRGRPLSGLETWCTWCRDPFLALDYPDPLTAMDEVKFSDPRRNRVAEIYEAWWKAHGACPIGANDLAPDVVALIDPQGRSRNFLAAQVKKVVGVRIAGYVLTGHRGDGTWSKWVYSLQKTETSAAPAVGGVL